MRRVAKAAKAAAAQDCPRRTSRKSGQHTQGQYRESNEENAERVTDLDGVEDGGEEA